MTRLDFIEAVELICKAVRSELHNGLVASDHEGKDNGAIADTYVLFIVAVLKSVPYPNKSQLIAAFRKCFDSVTEEEASDFAAKIFRCISHCRIKKKSAKSGVKLSNGTKTIISWIRKAHGGIPTSPLNKSLRKLANKVAGDSQKDSPKRSKVPKSSSSLSIGSSQKPDALRAMYGLSKATASEPTLPFETSSSEEVVQIVSSQEVETHAASHQETKAESKPLGKQWLCNKDLCVKRLLANGTFEHASMSPGSNGFALAQFEKEAAFQTEMPNILLDVPKVIKRPASKKAAAKKKKLKSSSSEDDSEAAGVETPGLGDSAPKVCKKPAAKVKASKSTVEQAAAAMPVLPATDAIMKLANECFATECYGECKAEFYSAKSYIRHKVEGSWKLIIGSTHSKHQAIVQALIPFVKQGLNKSDLLQERAVLEASDVD